MTIKYCFTLFFAFLSVFLTVCSPERKTDDGNISLDDIKLKTLDGEDIDFDEFGNKRIFINVWATWCKPCIEEMPTIAKAMEKVKDKNVVFLFASDEEPEQITKFAKQRGFPFQYVQLQNLEELKIQALPTTFIFNADGELVFSEMGYRNWELPENLDLITNK